MISIVSQLLHLIDQIWDYNYKGVELSWAMINQAIVSGACCCLQYCCK